MTIKKFFGTDGIRGRVGQYPISSDWVLKLGWALGQAIADEPSKKVLIGKDTRISGYMFESALEAGLSAAGIDVHLLGPMPTPAVAYLTRTLQASAGVVISASHNSFEDNGIKFFSSSGHKLSTAKENQIEKLIDNELTTVPAIHLGKAHRVNDAPGRYIEFCKRAFNSGNLRGLKIVVDCAHGATYHIAPHVLSELGADVIAIANEPNGININDNCGSTSPSFLAKAVLDHKADLGFALDGDGDRVIMVDGNGDVYDGDAILYILAINSSIPTPGVVGTVMSNMGLEVALKEQGMEFERTNVGDKYVFERLMERDWTLGGEPSGHILSLDVNTTGDGIVSALKVLDAMVERQSSLQDITAGFKKYPQILKNVTADKSVVNDPRVLQAVADIEQDLLGEGRVLLRASGTEPVIRIMVESKDESVVAAKVEQLVNVVEEVSSCQTSIA
ncbi:MAG: phosphoglucosamine mutase [Francisellaceae bacterium]|nr:phosphoglucosamine mutase [Francisellaceae bacterium]